MRKFVYTLMFVVALAFTASAQVRVGAFVGYTTSNDKSEAKLQDGGDFFPGFTASFESAHYKRFSFRVRGDVAKPQLPTLFTTDEGAERPSYEVRVNPEVFLNFGKVFVGGGFDAFYHAGLHNDEGEEYSRSYGVNPVATAGVRITRNHELSASYLFKDNVTYLSGVRANYFYTLPKGFRVGFEANRLQFRESNREGYIDPYYETDNAFKISFEIPLTGRK